MLKSGKQDAASFALSALSGLDDTRLKLGALQINNMYGARADIVDRIVKVSERALRKTRIGVTTKLTLFSILWFARLPSP
tara:strand:+ start:512 stop:751 length:240 start_codon:yes stop_codon:yes gene_type:complete